MSWEPLKIIQTGTSATFTGLEFHQHIDEIIISAKKSGCTYESSERKTKMVVKGTKSQMNEFVKNYNTVK